MINSAKDAVVEMNAGGVGTDFDTDVAEQVRQRLKPPPHYAVILHNDDYTTMEFVVEVLKRYFRKTEEEAMKVMLKVHHEGQGVAGVYSLEIAETKVAQVQQLAESRGYPLKCTVEPAD